MRQFVEKCWNKPNLNFDDLWWPDLKMNDQSSFVIIFFYALSNAAYRVSLRGSGAELDGVLPPPSRRVRRQTPPGAGWQVYRGGQFVPTSTPTPAWRS